MRLKNERRERRECDAMVTTCWKSGQYMNHGGNVWESGSPSGWTDFSANLRPEGPPLWVQETVRDAQRDIRFYPDPDMKRAREGLSAFLGVPGECVLPVPGGISAIDTVLGLSPGCVYIQPPTFCEYAVRAQVHGRRCETWSGKCRKGDTLVICNPNNPTGSVRKQEELLSLLDALVSDGANLLADEAFIEYCPEYSLRGNLRPGLIIVGSLSKILGTPGIRLGYICAAPETVLSLRKRMLPWPLDAFASEIAAHLPEHTDEIREDSRLNSCRRNAFARQLRNLGAEVFPSESNFLLADFRRGMSWAEKHLKARGILVRTCTSFGLPDSFWRLAVKTEAENTRFINEMEEILHAR